MEEGGICSMSTKMFAQRRPMMLELRTQNFIFQVAPEKKVRRSQRDTNPSKLVDC